MASPVDTTVKFYREDFPGAPVLNGVAGSLIGLLDACLCTGFGLRSATSLVVAGGVATLTLGSDVKNSNLLHSVILVENSSIAALNGEQRVTWASSTELKFATAAADGTATGSITVKTAPAGWEKKFSGTNKAVFKSLAVEANTSYLQVKDTGTTSANVRMYQTMVDVDTGTGAAPGVAESASGGFWAKSNTGSATANRWDLFADSRAFYFCPVPSSGVNPEYIGQCSYFFGDVVAYKSGDVFATAIFSSTTAPGGSVHYGNVFYGSQSGVSAACRFLRSYTGLGAATGAFALPVSGATGGMSGADGQQGIFPAQTDGGLRLSKIYTTEFSNTGSTAVLRGDIPGAYYVPQAGVGNYFARGDTITTGGKKLYAVHAGSNAADSGVAGGRGFFDITGPWR